MNLYDYIDSNFDIVVYKIGDIIILLLVKFYIKLL